MIDRCTNPNFRQWPDYGGRGITVCARWRERAVGFHHFVSDMGPRPDGYQLDRRDNDSGYSPENCRWVTRSEQQLNRRNTVLVEFEGVTYKATELAKRSGLKLDTIQARAATCTTLAEAISPARRVYKPGLSAGGPANGLRQKAKTHCPYGHPYTPENTFITPENFRRCKACRTKAGKILRGIA